MTRLLVELAAAAYTVFWVAHFGREALRCYGLLYPRGVRLVLPSLVLSLSTNRPTNNSHAR